jgi:hypothetical protein
MGVMNSFRVAVCLFGQPRFLRNPRPLESHRRFLLDRYETDVFCHFWFDPEATEYDKSDFSSAPGGCSSDYHPYVLPDTESRIQTMYNPIAYVSERPRVFEAPSPTPKFMSEYAAVSPLNISNMISQLYSWEKVLQLVSSSDRLSSYQHVVLIRYDSNLLRFPNLPSLQKGRTYAHATQDITITDPKFCPLLKPYTNFERYCTDVSVFDVACFKRLALREAGSELSETHEWKFGLVRSDADQIGSGGW